MNLNEAEESILSKEKIKLVKPPPYLDIQSGEWVELKDKDSRSFHFEFPPYVRVFAPGASGVCKDCEKELRGALFDTTMLPDTHPGKDLLNDAGLPFKISFVKYSTDGIFLSCLECALKLPEGNGFWKGENE